MNKYENIYKYINSNLYNLELNELNFFRRLSQHKQSEIDIIDTLNGVIDYLKSKGDE